MNLSSASNNYYWPWNVYHLHRHHHHHQFRKIIPTIMICKKQKQSELFCWSTKDAHLIWKNSINFTDWPDCLIAFLGVKLFKVEQVVNICRNTKNHSLTADIINNHNNNIHFLSLSLSLIIMANFLVENFCPQKQLKQ